MTLIQCGVFFTDSDHFEKISPSNLNEKLVRTTSQKLSLGTEVWISTSLFVSRNWHSKIIKFQPYEYVDKMQGGIFTTWTHTHRFTKISSKKTKISDEIVFHLPFWIFGRVAETILLRKLKTIFEYRTIKTEQIFGS